MCLLIKNNKNFFFPIKIEYEMLHIYNVNSKTYCKIDNFNDKLTTYTIINIPNKIKLF